MYILVTYPRFKATLENGLPAAGYLVWAFDAGGSTPADTYSNRQCTIKNENPIELDEQGEAVIYVNEARKLIYTTPTGTPSSPIWTMDYIGEQQEDIIQIASATPGTTYNQYAVSITPTYTEMPQDGFTLILIPDVDNLGTTPTTVFSGSGKNDCYFYGPYTGTTSGSIFTVKINDAVSVPNTFDWRKDGGTWTTGVQITTEIQNLIEGMTLQFAESTGHTHGDTWTVQVVTPARLNFCGLTNNIIYKNVGGRLVALDAGDMKAGIPASLSIGDNGTLWILNNPSFQVPASTTGERTRKEKTDDYTLQITDAGEEINFANTVIVTCSLSAAHVYKDRFFYLRAGGTANVIIQAYGSEKIYSPQNPAGSSTYILFANKGEVIQLQCNGVSWEVLTQAFQDNTVVGSRKNLALVVTSNTQATITADELVLSNAANWHEIVRAVNVTVSITTSGVNGLDTGVEASSTWYAVYVIWNGTTIAGLLSTSATSPTLPTGYLYYTRVGWVRNDGSSNLLRTFQRNYTANYEHSQAATAPVMANTANGDFTAVSTSSFVPQTAYKITVMGAITGPLALYFNPSLVTLAGGLQNWIFQTVTNTVTPLTFTLESTSIYYYAPILGEGAYTVAVSCLGWEDI